MNAEVPAAALVSLINGYQVSQAIHVAAELGIGNMLAAGPRAADDLAAEAEAHGEALHRLLRALASAGVLHEHEGRTFSLTPAGEALCTDAPESVAAWAAFVGSPSHWAAWGDLLHSVRTGASAFQHVHGVDVWEYRAARPQESATFDAAMSSHTNRLAASLLDTFDFAQFRTVIDVGGGVGTLLVSLLDRYPSMQGVLFDQPHVVAGAGDVLAAAGVTARCRVVGGSFFAAIPEGGDAYVLKAIIHDWEDEQAVAILRACRQALGADSALLVIERVLGPPNEGALAKFSDLNMLVATGGRERTLDEFAALFRSAELRLAEETPIAAGFSVIAALPA